MVSSREVVLNFWHGAGSVKELNKDLPSDIGVHIRRSAVRVSPLVQERTSENDTVVQSGGKQAGWTSRPVMAER